LNTMPVIKKGTELAMHVFVRIAMASIVALSVGSSRADVVPIEAKGVQLGSSESELVAKLPETKCYGTGGQKSCLLWPKDRAKARCGDIVFMGKTEDIKANSDCRINAEIELGFGPAAIVKSYRFEFLDGTLGSITVNFNTVQFARVVIALTEKYGPPTSDKVGTIQNRAGAKFDNRVVIWERLDGRIEAEERSGTIDDAYVRMNTPAYRSSTTKEFVDKAKDAAKKL
jgi:hypothetical protein